MTVRKCGRPTKAGTPCKNNGSGLFMMLPCEQHQTDADRETNRLMVYAYERGQKLGEERVQQTVKDQISSEKRRLYKKMQEDERIIHPFFKLREFSTNRQIVEVNGYAFSWDGEEDLKVGDEVMLPSSGWGEWAGTVFGPRLHVQWR